MRPAAALPRPEIERALGLLERRLLATRTPAGTWRGELSSSALATAVAVTALHLADPEVHAEPVRRGGRWLAGHVNADRGWGDTPDSRSSLATTVLVWSALTLAGEAGAAEARDGAAGFVRGRAGGLAPAILAGAIAAAYGRDRTFAAPILTVAALAGVLGEAPRCWDLVPQLPFEAGLLPHRLLALLRLPVVSYALPALIAIGLVRHHHAPTRVAPLRQVRDGVAPRVLRRLERLQPPGGGFLEATPLTAFVVASLAACGRGAHPVAARGVGFLLASQRPDGSWPVDSDLATWVTTLAVKALDASGRGVSEVPRAGLLVWLLGQQHRRRHPFTGAAPGGFAWSDLPGAVPDADDTAGALLALRHLDPGGRAACGAAAAAAAWLVGLQNRDGGVPTFCRGWGRLPFDRSCPDITAHAVRALAAWQDRLDPATARRVRRFIPQALAYLARAQRPDGAWRPLWFGNQWQPDGANDVYGTAQVVTALAGIVPDDPGLVRGRAFLVAAQNADGGWGRDAAGHSTVEETALAVSALAGSGAHDAAERGTAWLCRRAAAADLTPAPIGLYFASLWYAERLYPVIFAVTALGRVLAARAAASPGRAEHAEARVA